MRSGAMWGQQRSFEMHPEVACTALWPSSLGKCLLGTSVGARGPGDQSRAESGHAMCRQHRRDMRDLVGVVADLSARKAVDLKVPKARGHDPAVGEHDEARTVWGLGGDGAVGDMHAALNQAPSVEDGPGDAPGGGCGWCHADRYHRLPVARPQRDDELELAVDALAFGGLGVSRSDGFVIFSTDTVPGDRVRVRVRKSRRRFAEAELIEVIEPSPDRITPPCQYVPACGGCRLQHIDYGATLVAKREHIVDHLERIGHLNGIEVRPVDPAVAQFGYRNKMEYSAAPGPGGELRLGFHRRGRWDEVVNVDPCLLATASGNAARDTVRDWAVAHDIAPYDQRAQRGMLRHVVVREGIGTNELLVTVVTAPGAEELVEHLIAPMRAAHPNLVGLLHGVNDGVSEVTQGLPTRCLWGRDYFYEEVLGMRLALSAQSFFQTNTQMTGHLYNRVADAAGLDGTQVVYDLFCGVGSIGLTLAARARQVIGVEIVPEAAADAQRNAEANGVTDYRVLTGDVGRVVKEQRDTLPKADVAIIDPPRGGLSGRAIRRVLELEPEVLIYVSCHPATFADNAARFVAAGYVLEYVQPVDMFPNTPHVEAVARFVRDEAAVAQARADADAAAAAKGR
jgi:23S rRNA (uracil1939-C5)-methyltransferase